MKNSPSLKRFITLLISGASVFIEWLWYEHYWFDELFPRWVKESLNFYSRGHILVLGVYAALILGFCFTYGATKLNYYKTSELVVSIIFATVITNLITYAQISLMHQSSRSSPWLPRRAPIAMYWLKLDFKLNLSPWGDVRYTSPLHCLTMFKNSLT